MTNAPPVSDAERQRQYRRRGREELSVARAEVSKSLVENLVASGVLDKADLDKAVVVDPKRRHAALDHIGQTGRAVRAVLVARPVMTTSDALRAVNTWLGGD